jgi:hypothetical protein
MPRQGRVPPFGTGLQAGTLVAFPQSAILDLSEEDPPPSKGHTTGICLSLVLLAQSPFANYKLSPFAFPGVSFCSHRDTITFQGIRPSRLPGVQSAEQAASAALACGWRYWLPAFCCFIIFWIISRCSGVIFFMASSIRFCASPILFLASSACGPDMPPIMSIMPPADLV